jgi:hypothetical protein
MHDANFLSLIHDGYPARLASSQTAKLLGFGDHDIPVLVATGLLKPLGSPVPNAPKHFALVDVLSHATDRDWLNRATRTLAKHWQKKNCEQRNKRGSQTTSHISEAEGTV